MGGWSFHVGSSDRDFAVARLNSNGSLDKSFNGTGKQTIDFGSGFDIGWSVAARGDKVVVVGQTNQSDSNIIGVARRNNNGSLDSSFGAGGKETVNFDSDFRNDAHPVAL